LKPEKSTTISGGVVLTPHWVDGLSMSLDYYSINIKGAIATIGTTVILNQCAAGNQAFCSQLTFGNPPIVAGGPPSLSQIATVPINANSQDVSGIDFQADYQFPLLDGGMDLHLVGNYIDSQDQTSAGLAPYDYAGSVGQDSAVRGIPKFRSTASATYLEGPWQGTVQGRFIGEAKLNNAWGPLDVDKNHLPFVAYLDLRLSYKWNDNIQLYGAIDNVINTPPPLTPGTSNAENFYDQGITDSIYDAIGRQFRVGIRVHY
jgi:outer membrane receptor protein involved in Fe transport